MKDPQSFRTGNPSRDRDAEHTTFRFSNEAWRLECSPRTDKTSVCRFHASTFFPPHFELRAAYEARYVSPRDCLILAANTTRELSTRAGEPTAMSILLFDNCDYCRLADV